MHEVEVVVPGDRDARFRRYDRSYRNIYERATGAES